MHPRPRPPHAGAPLEQTVAALFLLLERAECSPAEMRSPAILMTILWMLEAYTSEARSRASVVLADYLDYQGGLLRCQQRGRGGRGGRSQAGAGCTALLPACWSGHGMAWLGAPAPASRSCRSSALALTG